MPRRRGLFQNENNNNVFAFGDPENQTEQRRDNAARLFRQSLMTEFSRLYDRNRQGSRQQQGGTEGGNDRRSQDDANINVLRNSNYPVLRFPPRGGNPPTRGRLGFGIPESGGGSRGRRQGVMFRNANQTDGRTQTDEDGADPCPNLSEDSFYQRPDIITRGQFWNNFDSEPEEDLTLEVTSVTESEEARWRPFNSLWQEQNQNEDDSRELVTNRVVEQGEGEEEYERVPSCSYLSMGMVFKGSQTVQNAAVGGLNQATLEKLNEWEVTVTIQACDMSTGYVCGMMQASNVAGASGSILTCWVGEIIDNVNHTFITDKWGALRSTDAQYWGLFDSFLTLPECIYRNGKSKELGTHPYIYMRWKEQFFVHRNPSNQLTISGFYYVALDRRTGSVQGWYFDKDIDNGLQELKLETYQAHEMSKKVKKQQQEEEEEENRTTKRYKGMQGQSFPAYALY
eukprot:TRINITY_DN3105_c0_g1_i3.p4 TRINITY_DN3105_c0_g1~~TRINITY_DN3105_c0_g1_i3.p4  ORF type:complete len:455 (-),score=81.67 TRINITY_DN3105_c0_g1_i3:2154-3518(-)